MPKRTDIKKILVIGSGPIVIGQAAEFDYAGTQACLALKEEGYEVVLCNSNPATIMTDTSIADKVYMEPLTLEYIAKIIRYERPDAILPSIGGQTGLNLAMQLEQKGILRECRTELLGTKRNHTLGYSDRHLPGSEIRHEDDLLPDKFLRLGIRLPYSGKNRAFAERAGVEDELQEFRTLRNGLAAFNDADAKIDFIEI